MGEGGMGLRGRVRRGRVHEGMGVGGYLLPGE